MNLDNVEAVSDSRTAEGAVLIQKALAGFTYTEGMLSALLFCYFCIHGPIDGARASHAAEFVARNYRAMTGEHIERGRVQ